MAFLKLENCSLNLPVYGAGNRSLKQMMLSKATGGRIAADSRKLTVVEALRDVSLDVRAGDRLGLVGHNGAGKTTLLRLLAGIYEPSAGSFFCEGRVTSLLDLTLGLDYEATGYENIVLRGLILGASKAEMTRLTPAIADFSELGDYLNMPVRTYSSGMVLRLAFAIVTSVHADILLMDEWLSVGDASFIQKAEKHMQEFVGKADILVLASHNAQIIQDLCNVIVELEHGTVKDVRRV
ncbi:sugar ABC transporter ATP-binding protein [Burkholderia sp. THE68]|jgi:lipopolysaccharide transport system ATP-binding protein|uniref:ABC transporter ATP-binding protein n=1 Tax=Burkholderia sp. THE68 TaxID=758782 RepID=UPI0013160D8F|nr:ABC transporter ATP-binding protein [Burkholderia sp. THE68]BBU28236.1 sugar ABC transporter ATP-binding protein [Burkholderia sp. THE68]